jgi:hypothetical protein
MLIPGIGLHRPALFDPVMKIEVAAPNFTFLNTRDLVIEESPFTGRVYFIKAGRIVAVGRQRKPETRSSRVDAVLP